MPKIAERVDLDPLKFKGALYPSVIRYEDRDGYYYRHQLPGPDRSHRTKKISNAESLQDAIDKAHLAFLEIRNLPTKKRKLNTTDYIDKHGWSDHGLPVGGVYIYTTDFDTIKIGKSSDFRGRFKAHQCSNPDQLKILCLIGEEDAQEMGRIESDLHKTLEKFCRLNEWFWYVPTVQNFVKNLQTEHGFKPFIYGTKPLTPGFN